MRIIDVNASVGFWPIQRFTDRTLVELESTYASQGVDEVWVSAIESILFPEPDIHDMALFERLLAFERYRPVKTINPLLGNWSRSLEKAARRHALSAVKLFPNYHDYSLESPAVTELCAAAGELGLPLLIQMRVNDERNQPTCLQVPGVKAQEVAQFSLRHPENIVIALCAYGSEATELAGGSADLLMDFSFLDGCDWIGPFDGILKEDRFVFGSHAPFMHVAAAKMKLSHFEISEPVRRAVAGENLLARLKGRT